MGHFFNVTNNHLCFRWETMLRNRKLKCVIG
jgi:hypothetical protein